jgi:DNA replication and repair protein RecF
MHHQLTGGLEWLRLLYVPNLTPEAPGKPSHSLSPQPASDGDVLEGASHGDLAAAFHMALDRRRREEITRGMTLVGPHRDELRFISGSPTQGTHAVDVGTYGSRGQQRTAVLALKLAELAWMKAQTRETPVLLLDEVLAELDATRRDLLLAQVDDSDQAILTATDPAMFSADFRRRAVMWEIGAGVVAAE